MGFLTNSGRIGGLQAMQVFWPDHNGKFPLNAGCELGVYILQPRLDIALTPHEIRASLGMIDANWAQYPSAARRARWQVNQAGELRSLVL